MRIQASYIRTWKVTFLRDDHETWEPIVVPAGRPVRMAADTLAFEFISVNGGAPALRALNVSGYRLKASGERSRC